MFTKSAKFYDALYHFKDYSGASEQLHSLIQRSYPGAKDLLDVGCGTGKHIEHLRHHYRVEGLDLNPDLLEIARQRCPGVPFYEGNMVNFNLEHSFDVVTSLFSSIAYVKTLDNLERTVSCMSHHLRSRGLLIIEPWITPEKYWEGRLTANFVDQENLKIAWMYTSEIEDKVSVFNINYLVGTPEGISHFTECHEMGLFTHEEYVGALEKAGLQVDYDPNGFFGRGMYLGSKEFG
jgi:SAM-dependent methyltransferase